MKIRRVVANSKVKADRGRVALERGPLVYCVEGIDQEVTVEDLVLPDEAVLQPVTRAELLGGIVMLVGEALAGSDAGSDVLESRATHITAIPYYAWAHREVGEMAIWLRRD